MWELTAENALDYLRAQGHLSPEPAQVVALVGGVSNLVLRVEQEERRFIVKQSRPQLRTRDAWFSDIERIHREQEVMELLAPLLPRHAIPCVLFADRERFVLAMEHAPEPANPWKPTLLGGVVDAATGETAGAILGIIHEVTAARRDSLMHLLDRRVFDQLRIDPFYRRIQVRCPDVRDHVEALIADMMQAREALCHGDFSPKNLLAYPGGLTLVDHETGHLGEPAMDIGFFFSHLLLKALHAPARYDDFVALVSAAWRGYANQVRYTSPDCLLKRGLRHLGVCLLARIDGTSPVDYLNESARDSARGLGRWLLREQPTAWEDVLTKLRTETCADR